MLASLSGLISCVSVLSIYSICYTLLTLVLQLLIFILFNSALPLSNVGSDFSTFLTLEDDGQAWWAKLTLVQMFVPVLIRLTTFIVLIFISIRKICDSEGRVTSEVMLKALKKVILNIPFFLPIYNLYLAYKLRRLRYGMEGFNTSNSARVETILCEVAECSFLESYFDAGGQAILQLIIIFSTGQASTMQQISIVLSLLSLAWGVSWGNLIQRSQDAADPNPALAMVIMIDPGHKWTK